MNIDELDTGDVVLFTACQTAWYNPLHVFDALLQWWTRSPFTHCGMILRNPTFIHPSLQGLYLWESGWENAEPDPQDGRSKLGVQITPLCEYLRNSPGCTVYVLKKIRGDVDAMRLTRIHHVVHNKPYDLDLIDWLKGAVNNDRTQGTPRTNNFWCSALVGYIMVRLGFFRDDVNWSVLRPADFASSPSLFTNTCDYASEPVRVLY